MQKSFKELYSFSVDKEIEKEVVSTKINKKTNEEIRTTKKVKENVPVQIVIKKPTKRQLEEAELEYSIEMSKCIKKGVLTKAMLAKKYSDSGGLMSETDAQDLVDSYKNILDLQNEYSRLEIVENKTEEQQEKRKSVTENLAKVRRKIVELESQYHSLFDHTADTRALNRLILWYVLMLTHIKDGESVTPYFNGQEFSDKLDSYYSLEEGEDPLYFAIIKKVSTVLSFWFYNQANSTEEFDSLMKKVESGDV